jgi:hypothetical protein
VKTAVKIVLWCIGTIALHAVLVRLMAHGHVAHSLLAGGPSLGAALLAAALVVVRFVAVVVVPGALATAAVLATAHYFVGSKSTGTSSGGDALAEAEGTGTSIGVSGTE